MTLTKSESPVMFDRIAQSYDRLNTILSLGMDKGWRRRVAAYLPERTLDLLDLACGTGEQLMSLLEKKESIRSAVGIDLSDRMLELARVKIAAKPYHAKIKLRRADCLQLPFAEETFDAATFAFGVRNVTDPLAALKEIRRVLKPSGRCLILEFSLPPSPIKPFYLFYLRHLLPHIGRYFSKDPAAYRYLNETIETFPSGFAFCSMMKSASFSAIKQIPMALGAVTLYLGEKK